MAEKPSFILGAGRSLAPRRAPCFDTQCQNSYGVTFDKSNKTDYTVTERWWLKHGKNINATRQGKSAP